MGRPFSWQDNLNLFRTKIKRATSNQTDVYLFYPSFYSFMLLVKFYFPGEAMFHIWNILLIIWWTFVETAKVLWEYLGLIRH
jgi:hypothetical protein